MMNGVMKNILKKPRTSSLKHRTKYGFEKATGFKICKNKIEASFFGFETKGC
jgi:hypothetical protein